MSIYHLPFTIYQHMKYCTVCKEKYEDNVSFCPRDGEVLEDDPTSLVDRTLDGQYHIESLLGKGGMGAVYCARHILLGDRVAIKVLPPEMRNNADWLRRFRREGQAARRFRHPNAVTVYDLRTTSDGLIYMVMEYVEGHTLDAELRARGRFTPREAFDVLEPVMSVLNAAHEMGVVHRDLKPENIMLGGSTEGRSTVKLLDLGIAKMREVAGTPATAATALTMAGQILGTPYYMSPEQWGEVPRDGNSEIDGRADIYSLGTVFYELIAARKPFLGESLADLRRGHVAVTPRPLHEFVSDVSQEFSRAIARAMSKDRDDRQATAEELDKELREALGLPQAERLFLSSSKNIRGSLPLTDSPATDAPNQFTRGIPGGRETKLDSSAPTVITSDSETTTDATPPAPPAPPSAAVPQATIPSLADVDARSPSNAVSQPSQPSSQERVPSLNQSAGATAQTIATNPNVTPALAHAPGGYAQAATMPVAAKRRSPI
ncbi:MAG: serine/threonine-protein kinase, partial [Pyrinomonadaceae bacterium]